MCDLWCRISSIILVSTFSSFARHSHACGIMFLPTLLNIYFSFFCFLTGCSVRPSQNDGRDHFLHFSSEAQVCCQCWLSFLLKPVRCWTFRMFGKGQKHVGGRGRWGAEPTPCCGAGHKIVSL